MHQLAMGRTPTQMFLPLTCRQTLKRHCEVVMISLIEEQVLSLCLHNDRE